MIKTIFVYRDSYQNLVWNEYVAELMDTMAYDGEEDSPIAKYELVETGTVQKSFVANPVKKKKK